MSHTERHQLQQRVDEIFDALHDAPVHVADPRDVVVLPDGHAAPCVLPHEIAEPVLTLLVGPTCAREAVTLAEQVEHGSIAIVIVIGTWVHITSIGTRLLAKGGDA